MNHGSMKKVALSTGRVSTLSTIATTHIDAKKADDENAHQAGMGTGTATSDAGACTNG